MCAVATTPSHRRALVRSSSVGRDRSIDRSQVTAGGEPLAGARLAGGGVEWAIPSADLFSSLAVLPTVAFGGNLTLRLVATSREAATNSTTNVSVSLNVRVWSVVLTGLEVAMTCHIRISFP